MSRRRITIQELADELNISASTVSRALSDNSNISDKTKEDVRKLAEKHGYFQQVVAMPLLSRKQRLIAVVVPNCSESFFCEFVSGVRNVCRKNDFQLIVFESGNDFQKTADYINYIFTLPVSGVIFYIENVKKEELRVNNIPVVLTGNVDSSFPFPKVIIDNYMNAFRAVEHLYSAGCKKMVYLAGHYKSHVVKQRVCGYQAALNQYKLDGKDAVLYSELTVKDLEVCIKQVMAGADEPDGIITDSGLSAVKIINQLGFAGYNIPRDIKILSFEDNVMNNYYSPSITSISCAAEEIGTTCVNVLFSCINKRNVTSKSDLFLKPSKLILRNSTLRPGNELPVES